MQTPEAEGDVRPEYLRKDPGKTEALLSSLDSCLPYWPTYEMWGEEIMMGI